MGCLLCLGFSAYSFWVSYLCSGAGTAGVGDYAACKYIGDTKGIIIMSVIRAETATTALLRIDLFGDETADLQVIQV